MRDLLDMRPITDTDAARRIAALMAGCVPIARCDINVVMRETFGGSDADGRWSQRDSFEVLEHAFALHLATRPYAVATFSDVVHATALMERMPTQTVRSEDQTELAAVLNTDRIWLRSRCLLAAASAPDDIVLEPSAGNGLLDRRSFRRASAALQLNELDPRRRRARRRRTLLPGADDHGA